MILFWGKGGSLETESPARTTQGAISSIISYQIPKTLRDQTLRSNTHMRAGKKRGDAGPEPKPCHYAVPKQHWLQLLGEAQPADDPTAICESNKYGGSSAVLLTLTH